MPQRLSVNTKEQRKNLVKSTTVLCEKNQKWKKEREIDICDKRIPSAVVVIDGAKKAASAINNGDYYNYNEEDE